MPSGKTLKAVTAFRSATVAMVADVVRDYTFTRGPLGLVKLGAKTLLMIPRFRTHRRWLRVVAGPATSPVLSVMPRLAFRHSSAYLFGGLDWRLRVAFLTAHYDFINRHLDPPWFADVLEAGAVLWSAPLACQAIEIRLHGPPLHREGDLELRFSVDTVVLWRLAFSIVPAAFFGVDATGPSAGHLIYIGDVQGAAGQLDAIRDATKRCHDIAPPDLMMSALAGLAIAWGIDGLMSAGALRHLSAGKMAATGRPFDYAALWSRYHATQTPDGHYRIALPYVQRPLQEIGNRHRKRTVRKRRFKAAVTAAVLNVAGRSAPT